jgi:hypothetical protein
MVRLPLNRSYNTLIFLKSTLATFIYIYIYAIELFGDAADAPDKAASKVLSHKVLTSSELQGIFGQSLAGLTGPSFSYCMPGSFAKQVPKK